LFEAMKGETIPLGERILAEERSLDRLFAEKRVTQILLDAATSRIAAAQRASTISPRDGRPAYAHADHAATRNRAAASQTAIH